MTDSHSKIIFQSHPPFLPFITLHLCLKYSSALPISLRVSLCSPGQSGTCGVDQAGLCLCLPSAGIIGVPHIAQLYSSLQQPHLYSTVQNSVSLRSEKPLESCSSHSTLHDSHAMFLHLPILLSSLLSEPGQQGEPLNPSLTAATRNTSGKLRKA